MAADGDPSTVWTADRFGYGSTPERIRSRASAPTDRYRPARPRRRAPGQGRAHPPAQRGRRTTAPEDAGQRRPPGRQVPGRTHRRAHHGRKRRRPDRPAHHPLHRHEERHQGRQENDPCPVQGLPTVPTPLHQQELDRTSDTAHARMRRAMPETPVRGSRQQHYPQDSRYSLWCLHHGPGGIGMVDGQPNRRPSSAVVRENGSGSTEHHRSRLDRERGVPPRTRLGGTRLRRHDLRRPPRRGRGTAPPPSRPGQKVLHLREAIARSTRPTNSSRRASRTTSPAISSWTRAPTSCSSTTGLPSTPPPTRPDTVCPTTPFSSRCSPTTARR